MNTHPPVTVIGLGPMGQAMTRALLSAGHPVTVWNRTPSRADGVVSNGARRARTASEAIAASDLIILSLTHYAAMWEILDDSTDNLAGKFLVNLSSDTPTTTREASAWARSRGAAFLAGGVMGPAPMVGTADAYVFYSGSESVLNDHYCTLAAIGQPRFLGADPGRAQLMYQAHLDLFLTILAGFAHATAMVGTAGIDARTFLPHAMQLFEAVPAMIAPEGAEALGARIDAGEHPGDEDSNTMLGATADHIMATSRAVGVDTSLPALVRSVYQRAHARGWAADGWTRAVDIFRDPAFEP